MEQAELPLLSASATPAQALKAMRNVGRSAVVLDEGGTTFLLMGGAVAEAWKAGLPTLHEVVGREPVATITPAAASSFSLDVDVPFNTEKQYGSFFASVGPEYAHRVLGGTPAVDQATGTPIVTIITASEAMRPALVMLGAYICNGPKRHTFPIPVVTNGVTCPLCPTSAHATVALVIT